MDFRVISRPGDQADFGDFRIISRPETGSDEFTVLSRPQTFTPPNTYDETEIAKQGAAVRSKGVNPDGSVPGYKPTLNPADAGDNWTTIGVTENGNNLTYVVPENPKFDEYIKAHREQIDNEEVPNPYLEDLKKTNRHYGVFETDQAGADFMNKQTAAPPRRNPFTAAAESEELAARGTPLSLPSNELPKPGAPEESFLGALPKQLRAAGAGMKQVFGGALQAAEEAPTEFSAEGPPGKLFGLPEAPRTEVGAKIAAAAAKDLADNVANVRPFSASGITGQILQSAPLMIAAAVTTFLTKNPVLGAAVVGTGTGTQEYAQERGEGVSPGKAAIGALVNGISESLGEEIPLGMLMKPGGKFLTDTLKVAGAEGVQEALTQIVQTGYDKAVLHPDMTWGDAWSQVVQAGIVGSVMGGGLSVATHPFVSPKASGTQETPSQGKPEAEIPQGERAKVAAAPLTPGDVASPLPNDLIADGKRIIAEAVGNKGANDILSRNGWPATGTRVSVERNGESKAAQIVDAFSTSLPSLGATADGLKLQFDDGTTLEAFRRDLEASGTTIRAALGEAEKAGISPSAPSAEGETPTITPSGVDQIAGDEFKVVQRPAAPSEQEIRTAILDGPDDFDREVMHAQLSRRLARNGQLTFRDVPQEVWNKITTPGVGVLNRAFEHDPQAVINALAPYAPPEGTGTRTEPIKVTAPEHLETASEQVHTEPTPAQKEAGNYRKGHIDLQGLPITIENPKGSIRSKQDESGKTLWSTKMPAAYGYIKRTVDNTNEQVDVYVGDDPQSKFVHVISQHDLATGKFDEPKVMIGFPSREAAVETYKQGFSDGKGAQRIGNIRTMSMEGFKQQLAEGKFKKPQPVKRAVEPTPKTEATTSGQEHPAVNAEERLSFRQALSGEKAEASFAGRTYRLHPVKIGNNAGFSLKVTTEDGFTITRGGAAHQGLWSRGRAIQEAFEEAFPDTTEAAQQARYEEQAKTATPFGKPIKQEKKSNERVPGNVPRQGEGEAQRPERPGGTQPGNENLGQGQPANQPGEAQAKGAKGERAAAPEAGPGPGGGAGVQRADYGASNTFVTKDRAEELRARLRNKLKNQASAGIDPEILSIGAELTAFHIEAGARKFLDLAAAISNDLGVPIARIRPYLRAWYNSARDLMEDAGQNVAGMDAPDTVKAALETLDERSAKQNEPAPVGAPGVGEAAGNVAERQPRREGPAEGVGTGPAENVQGPGIVGAAPGPRTRQQGARNRTPKPEGGNAAERREGAGEPGAPVEGTGIGRREQPGAARPNYHITNPEALFGGGPKARFARNKAAIEAFRSITEEARPPTQAELDAMAAYTGWGSFGQELFQGSWDRSRPKPGWENENAWLREHLGKDEWDSAQSSIVNAHYTDPPTVTAMWDIARRMGFMGGRVLEPSMGVGNFFGLMPREVMAQSELTGIELDKLTGGMAKILYPHANVQIKGYQDSKTADNFYDLVIGNWPFAKEGPPDRRYSNLSPSLHDYFFVKALDQVRPGGIVMGITSAFTMDRVSRSVRLHLARNAELVAAFRMPSGAFEKYAGTSVVADIIILQKREAPAKAADAEWIDTKKVSITGNEINLNNYWLGHKDHILGRLSFGTGSTYGAPSMIVERTSDFPSRFAKMPGEVAEGIYHPVRRGNEPRFVSNTTKDREGSVTVQDDKLYVVQGDRLAPLEAVVPYRVANARVTKAREDQIRALVDMRRIYAALINAEREGAENTESLRTQLRKRYEAFSKAHGTIIDSEGAGIFARMKEPYRPALLALETKDGKPSRILYEPTIRSRRKLENPSVRDAFVMVRNETTQVDLQRVAELSKKPVAEVERELLDAKAIYRAPGGFEVADQYLSGNVRRKLREAEEAKAAGQDMDESIAALKSVIPADVPYFRIEAKLGAPWVSNEYYEQFIASLLGVKAADEIKARYTLGRWKIDFENDSYNSRPEARASWGHSDLRFNTLLQHAFNNTNAVIRKKDSDGNEFVDELATKEVNNKITRVREEFTGWVWKDAARRVDLEQNYNQVMNAIAKTRYDGSFLELSGMALKRGSDQFSLRAHQMDAIWRGVINQRGIYAHEVGTGKTYTMGGVAVESRRYGLARKPLIFAHNANSADVASGINEMYPGANVLYVDNLSPDNIDVTLRRIANEDWDAVVVPHSLIDRFSLTAETMNELMAADIAALESEAIEAAQEDGANLDIATMDSEDGMKKVRSATAKQLVAARNRIKNMIKEWGLRASREGAIPFEELGVDMVMIDEVQEFKKPPLATKMRIRGLNTQTSNRSIALRLLTDYIKRLRNGNGVHTFTGTPITNTLAEIYNQMRYVMDDQMAKDGVRDWDPWFATFASPDTNVELTAAAEYEPVTRLASFVNVAELRRMVGQYMDTVFADEMPEFKPRATASGKTMLDEITDKERDELTNGRAADPQGRPYKKIVNDVGELGPQQRAALRLLVQRSKEFKNAGKKERREMMLKGDPRIPVIVETDAANASLDIRLYNGDGEDHPDSKVNRAARNIIKLYREDPNVTAQAVFVERGFSDATKRVVRDTDGKPKRDENENPIYEKVARFNLAKDLVEKLVDGGIPEKQIAIVDGKVSKQKRKEIADKMNSGEIKVVIGSSDTLGVGVNMQRNLRAMHHLDAPWTPGDLEQRNGRGWRQGNLWNTVLEIRYITNKLDGRRWQVLATKQKFITAFMKADDSVRIIDGDSVSLDEGVSASDLEETLAQAAGDPRILIKNKLQADIRRLEERERLHSYGIVDAQERQKRLAREIAGLKKDAADFDKDAAAWAAVKDQPFAATIEGKTYSERKDADEALTAAIDKLANNETRTIGTVRGFTFIAARNDKTWNAFTLKGPGTEYVVKPSMASIESVARHIAPHAEEARKEIADKTDSAARMGEAAQLPFTQADQLAKKRQQLKDLLADLQGSPEPPPAWLTQGAPVLTDIWVREKENSFLMDKRQVEGHKWADDGYFVLTAEGPVPYLQALTQFGEQIYEPHPFEPPPKREAKPGEQPAPPAEEAPKETVADIDAAIKKNADAYYDNKIERAEFDAKAKALHERRERLIGTSAADVGARESITDFSSRIETKELRNKIRSLIDSDTTPKKLLSYIAENSKDPKLKAVAEAIGRVVGDGVRVKALNKFVESKQGPRYAVVGQFLPSKNLVLIDTNGPWPEQTFLHEMVHAITEHALKADTPAGVELKNLYGAFQQLASWKGDQNVYGFTDANEFVAEALTNPDFQRTLGEVMYRGKLESYWHKFVSIIRKMLGLPQRDALEYVLQRSPHILATVEQAGREPMGLSNAFMNDSATRYARVPLGKDRTVGAVTFADTATEDRYKKAKQGLDGVSTAQAARDWWQNLKAGMTRTFKDLPHIPKYADLIEQLRKLKANYGAATADIERMLTDLVGDMNKAEFDLFSRKVILDDLSWEASLDHDLPFGFNNVSVNTELAKVDAALAKRPDLIERVRMRKLMVREIADRLVKAGVLDKEQVKNPAYYRHVVLEYAQAEASMARASVANRLRSPYWAKRLGSQKDINANILEAEFDWLRKALHDIRAAETIDWIKKSKLNARKSVAAAARAHNETGTQKIIAREKAAGGPYDKKGRTPTEALMQGFKEMIGFGFGTVRRELDSGALVPPPQFRQAADAIVNQTQDDNALPFLGWILDNSEPGAVGAATAFKAIAQRRAFVKDRLGENYADPTDIKGLIKKGLAPDGYVAWQPEPGKLFYTAQTLSEASISRFFARVAAGESFGLGQSAEALALADEIRKASKEVLAVGGDKYTMVLPEEVAETLNNINDPHIESLFQAVIEVPLRAWKQWVLINPLRVLKYNLNNLSGDLDAMIAGNPRIARRVPQATAELWRVIKKGEEPTARYKEAVERDVFNANFTVQEIPDISELGQFRHLMGERSAWQKATAPFGATWRQLRKWTTFRENILRYAAYLDYADRIAAGESAESMGYGASRPEMVDAVTDDKDRAALLARELVGDYGAVSAFGRNIRRTTIPFFSWMEINAKRYWRLSWNAYRSGVGQGLAKSGAIGAALGLRTTAYLGLRMFALYGLILLWNNLVKGDDEDKLDPEQARQLHVVLGHTPDGAIVTLRLQGAVSDFLSWFGLTDAAGALSEVSKGRAGVLDVLKAIAKAPINKIWSGLTPVFSVPLTMASGATYFPDVFNPMPIHDKWREVFRLFSLDPAYDRLTGKPVRGVASTAASALVYQRDPGEIAYDEVRGLAFNWVARERGEAGVNAASTARGEALRDWRLAARYGDQAAGAAAVKRMRALGVRRQDALSSLRNAAPLGPLPQRDRTAFMRTLDAREQKRLREAETWYRETYVRGADAAVRAAFAE